MTLDLFTAERVFELMLDMPSGGLPRAGSVSAHAAEIVISAAPIAGARRRVPQVNQGSGVPRLLLDGLGEFYA